MDAEQAAALAKTALGALEGLATDALSEQGMGSVEGQMAHTAVHVLSWLAGLGAEAAIAAAVSRDYTSDSVRFIDET